VFGEILCHDRTPPVHRDLAQQAVERAASLGAPEGQVAALRYVVARRCAEDVEGAKALLDHELESQPEGVSLNNVCWYLMTDLPTLGRFDWYACALAERMLADRDSMDYFEFDTVALAMFLVGRHDEAVDLQETAMQRGGQGNPEYAWRLARYRAAASAPPR
jgi:hypothetical protein